MAVTRCILMSSTAVVITLVVTLFLKNAIVTGTSQCSDYDFPCENGECIDTGLWCDTVEDCSDGSDEKYCKKSTFFNKDPNNCSSTYFKCNNGPCIPMVGRCDSYNNCEDSSDEKNCLEPDSSPDSDSTSSSAKPTTPVLEIWRIAATTSKTISPATTPQSGVKFEESHSADSFKTDQKSVQIVLSDYLDLQPSEYSLQRKRARDWLLSQMRSDFGWGDETPRAITALYLSEMERSNRRNESDMLMVKQLEVQIALNNARNETKTMKLTDLALYINALMVSCKNPKNFYGDDLVRTLRNGVIAAQKDSQFVNPSVYLTLCMNNASTYDDTRKLHDIHTSRSAMIGRMDIQALALLTSTCLYRNTNLLTASMYEGLKRQFLHRLNTSGFPGNVYEASLLMQALRELKVSLPGLLQSILKRQQDDGSFGGILATYLVLPVLSGRSFIQINEHCSQRYSTDPAPIEVLQNMKHRKIYVRYTLKNGNPSEITETIEMRVAEGINFLDVMRLAQEINPKYRFKLEDNREIPVVYSIGGIPNDAEKGMFWTLYFTSNSSRVTPLSPYPGNIKQLIPHAGDEYVFWMKSI